MRGFFLRYTTFDNFLIPSRAPAFLAILMKKSLSFSDTAQLSEIFQIPPLCFTLSVRKSPLGPKGVFRRCAFLVGACDRKRRLYQWLFSRQAN